MAALIRHMFPKLPTIAVLAGALVYTFNQFTLSLPWSAFSFLLLQNALLPLVVLFWMRMFERNGWRNVAYALMVWMLALTPTYVASPVALLDISLLFVLTVTFFARAATKQQRVSVVVKFAALLGSWIVLNLFWILPLAHYSSAESARVYSLATDQASLFQLNSPAFMEAIRFGGFWGLHGTYKGDPYSSWHTYYTGWISRLTYVIPILVVAGLYSVYRRKTVRVRKNESPEPKLLASMGRYDLVRNPRDMMAVRPDRRLWLWSNDDERRNAMWSAAFLVAVAVLALLVGSKTFSWFDDAKVWLLAEVGLRDPLRSVYARFMPYLTLAFAPLIAVGIAHIYLWVSRTAEERRNYALPLAAVPVALVLIVGVIIPKPLLFGNFLAGAGVNASNHIKVPNEYDTVAKLLDKPAGDYTVVSYPQGENPVMPLNWHDADEGYLGPEPLSLYTDRAFVFRDGATPKRDGLINGLISGGATDSALRLLNARFVVLHRDTNTRYTAGVPSWVGTDVDQLKRRFDGDQHFTRVFDGSDLLVYENTQWKGTGVFAVPKSEMRSPDIERYLRPLDYSRTWDGFDVSPGQLKDDEALVINRPADARWNVPGAKSVPSASGLTVFEPHGASEGKLTLRNADQRRTMFIFVVTMVAIAALAAGLAWAPLRRRAPALRRDGVRMRGAMPAGW
jgi:hypothetical protein